MSSFSIHPTTPIVHVFRTPNNKLQIRTEIRYQRKTVFVKRTSTWYDYVDKKNKKRTEVQQFNCEEPGEPCHVNTLEKFWDSEIETFVENYDTEEVEKYTNDLYLTTF